MNLKDFTKEKHVAAERTNFMRAVLKQKIPARLWADFIYQKTIIFSSIECVARDAGLTLDILEIERALKLYQDAKDHCEGNFPKLFPVTVQYSHYILDLAGQPEKILAHFYVWHMADLHGGQQIKKLVPGPHRHLEFDDVEGLKAKVRAKLANIDNEEVLVAFDWAIKLLQTYDNDVDI